MNPRPLLTIISLFGELIEHSAFVDRLEYWLSKLYSIGAKATLAAARNELKF